MEPKRHAPDGDSELLCRLIVVLRGLLLPLPPQTNWWGRSPPPRFIKLNIDGSFNNSIATRGFIIRDWIGKLLQVGASFYGQTTTSVVEVRALRDGIYVAVQVCFNNIVIEGDKHWKEYADLVVNFLIIEDVCAWSSQGIQNIIKHVFREANIIAPWLSKFGIPLQSHSLDIYISI